MKNLTLVVLLARASFGAGSIAVASAVNADSEPRHAVELEADPVFVTGQTGFYTLHVTVAGAASTTMLPTVTLTVPPALTISGTPNALVGLPSGGCSVSGQTVTCVFGELLASPAPPAVVWVPVTPAPGAAGTVAAAVAYLVGASSCTAQACASNVVATPVLARPPAPPTL